MNGKSTGAAFTLLLFALLLGEALTGESIQPVGYNQDCMNQLDDDADGGVDGDDGQCFEYPYADGNGESITEPIDRYTGSKYASLFEYHITHTGDPLGAVCFAGQTGMYDETDTNRATQWLADNELSCQGQGP